MPRRSLAPDRLDRQSIELVRVTTQEQRDMLSMIFGFQTLEEELASERRKEVQDLLPDGKGDGRIVRATPDPDGWFE